MYKLKRINYSLIIMVITVHICKQEFVQKVMPTKSALFFTNSIQLNDFKVFEIPTSCTCPWDRWNTHSEFLLNVQLFFSEINQYLSQEQLINMSFHNNVIIFFSDPTSDSDWLTSITWRSCTSKHFQRQLKWLPKQKYFVF